MKNIFLGINRLWNAICNCHRSDDATAGGALINFFFPRFTPFFLLRLCVIAALASALFGLVLVPCFISGASMEPTVKSVGFTFCWRGRYLMGREPQRGDIVIIEFVDRVFFLKRVVALPGETVEFRSGNLYIDGVRQIEPYVKFVCNWNLPPRKVDYGNYYVIGDNRSMPMEEHRFGQVTRSRIIGAPLW